MKIQNFVVFTVFILSTGAYAASAPQNFSSKERCYDHFFSKNSTSDMVAAEDFCKDKYVKSSDDICAEAKLLDYKKKNSISSADEPKYLRKYKNECIQARNDNRHNLQISAQSAQQDRQAQQQQTQISQRNAQIAAAAATKQKQEDNAKDVKTTAAILAASRPIIKDATSAYKGAEAVTAATTGAAAAASTASGANAVTGTQAAATTAQTVAPVSPGVGASATEAAAWEIESAKKGADFAKIKDLNVAGEKLGPAAKTDVANVAKGAEITTAAPSAITAAAEVANSKLTGAVSAATSPAIATLELPGFSLPFAATATAYMDFQAFIETKYIPAKKGCTSLTEATEMLCLNGKSPTVAALKVVVNNAAPILMAVGSAQKACSKTAELTRYVGIGLTVAKGLCVGSQAACTGKCWLDEGTLESGLAAGITKIQGAFDSDYTVGYNDCLAKQAVAAAARAAARAAAATPAAPALEVEAQMATAVTAECFAGLTVKQTANTTGIAALKAAVATELAPTPGTINGLAANCKMKAMDIATFGLNIASVYVAEKSAKACEESLAASSAAGAAVTTAQYCDIPANASSPFCKCQKNSNQVGCPGYQANSNNEVTKDIAGTNLKPNGGLNGFASSAKTAAALPKNSALDGKINNADETSPGKNNSAVAGEPSNSAGSSDANKFAKAGGAGNSAANAALDAAEKEKKKWSFGSAFANSVSSLFGGKNSKTPGSNGNMKLKQDEAAIQRKIASDKLADEITTASGKSNWEKVHQVYSIKENTLMRGQ